LQGAVSNQWTVFLYILRVGLLDDLSQHFSTSPLSGGYDTYILKDAKTSVRKKDTSAYITIEVIAEGYAAMCSMTDFYTPIFFLISKE